MLTHLNQDLSKPKRVIVIGANGFIGHAIVKRLMDHGIKVVALGRAEVDLLSDKAEENLSDRIAPGDAVVAVAAIAPAKDLAMVMANLKIARAIAAAVKARGDDVGHVLNISSDAVYGDTPTPLNEMSATAPESYHGVMHLAREVHFRSMLTQPLAVLRPTLVYGAADPHNGYGPNRFMRLAATGEDIMLFGEGEELRDHILVDDVAALTHFILMNRSVGVLNAVTGHVTSFKDIALQVAGLFPNPVAVKGTSRTGPMPHNGYRPFDISAFKQAFPTFRYTPIQDGLLRVYSEKYDLGAGARRT